MDELQIGAGTPQEENHEAKELRQSGKCARCGRALRRVYVVDGATYGPVCVRKMGYAIAADNSLQRLEPRRREIPNTTQLPILAPEDAADVVYTSDSDRSVTVHRAGRTYQLPVGLEHVNHSPDGFNWGYGGSGPAQLAFAIMFDYLGHDRVRAQSLYQDFKWKVISKLDQNVPFILRSREIEHALTSIEVARINS